uniref:Ribosomal_L7Ae domain-containing protein n=1 Tax=Angiostrongylus cantonensis TaxID=6313 RepID=A0A0K0D583_ANGCA
MHAVESPSSTESDKDNLTVDDREEEKAKELIVYAPPLVFPGAKEQCIQERKKAGHPLKKFRGRLAKQTQAIRDAEIDEKVAFSQKEIPIVDFILKHINDSTVELPLEAAALVDSLIIHDKALFCEVGKVQKRPVTQISLKKLQPKTVRKASSGRWWKHLSTPVRSKRLEYQTLNITIAQCQPPHPSLGSNSRG